ncbi:probable inactive receptor-like protein kinase At3g56050 [Ziziphus jujuba]|uniref:Probable inactive receptor-like protein kinase At3g56050 n=1 Tax=Ziziphus jujuba TaxID=326968 RepID=A0ABM3IDW4_ZIZJJ|nr:probable inactive receptor-like protein kinase At3g56050 [Ziziphus jujuba]
MGQKWHFNRFRDRLGVFGIVVACFLFQNSGFCWSLNDEGLALLRIRERVVSDPFGALSNWNDDGHVNPCSWFGVECSDGKVVVLNLKDLCLGGTLAPEITNLVHIKSIILRNNSFTGIIPEGIGKLEELEMLDLGYNNFSVPLPGDLGSNLSLAILLLDNNGLLGSMTPEIYDLEMISEFQVDESLLFNGAKELCCSKIATTRKFPQTEGFVHRTLQQAQPPSPFNRSNKHSPADSPAGPTNSSTSSSSTVNSTAQQSSAPSPSPTSSHSPSPAPSPPPSPSPSPSPPPSSSRPSPPNITVPDSTTTSKNHQAAIIGGAVGGGIFLVLSIIGIYLYMNNKVATVKPWATGLSGQLQKAFITGVPKLKRSELVTACEDFSNVIGTSPIGTVYKGTLSNGVEIAVASVTATSTKDWSRNLEVQFRKKIDTLSKVNHKNFVNLIGYCVEEEPLTRMMVFEYAPNGTLFEHLHIKESEHLDWAMRVRILMGMAYCLEHMHQLEQPIAHNNLNSSAVRLTEDYAAKVSELSFWNEISAEVESPGKKLPKAPSASLESNVYSFGVILFEMITGRLPYSVDSGSLEDWASDYVRGQQSLKEMVDPTLTSFVEEELEQLGDVIKFCVHPDPKQRPTMRQVSSRLRDVTGISPDGATPKLSPLWWAELELMSTEAV